MLKATPRSPSFLSRERTVAAPGFRRWLVPPAALAIHLCIGMIYGFSVFWLPPQRAVGVAAPKVCSNELSSLQSVFATDCDWENKALGWTFSLAIAFLGSSAAKFGHWLETAGLRKTGLALAFCLCGGLLISAIGVYSHQIYLLWLGSGRDRRNRSWPWLYLAGLDADEMVSRSAWPGDGPRHHGLWRRLWLALVVAAWTAVGAPLTWGVWVTPLKTAAIFH